jgi:hypothetical protein
MSEEKKYKNLARFKHYNQTKGTTTSLTASGSLSSGKVFFRIEQSVKEGEYTRIIIALDDAEVSELIMGLIAYILERKRGEL